MKIRMFILLLIIAIVGIGILPNNVGSISDSHRFPKGALCDLTFSSVTYDPDPPECNRIFTIYCMFKDNLGNYNESSVIVNYSSDIPLYRVINLPFFQGGSFYFIWPPTEATYYVKLTVEPKGNWTETNWEDNTVTFENLSPDLTPIFLLGFVKNTTHSGDLIRFNAESVMYIQYPSLKVLYWMNNQRITLPKSLFGYVGDKYVFGLFL